MSRSKKVGITIKTKRFLCRASASRVTRLLFILLIVPRLLSPVYASSYIIAWYFSAVMIAFLGVRGLLLFCSWMVLLFISAVGGVFYGVLSIMCFILWREEVRSDGEA